MAYNIVDRQECFWPARMEAKKLQVDHRTPIEIVRHLDIPVPRKIYGRRFTLYPPLAAEQVDTIPWREATQSGELVKLDDGYALTTIGSLPGHVISTPVGSYGISRKHSVLYEEVEENIRNYKVTHKVPAERARFAARIVAAYFMNGAEPQTRHIGKLITPTATPKRQKAVGFYNIYHNAHFREMVMDEVSNILRKSGLTENFVVDCLVEARKIAVEQNDARALIAVSREAEEYLGVKDRARKETEPVELVEWDHVLQNKTQGQLEEAKHDE
jgi:hypothetical protein